MGLLDWVELGDDEIISSPKFWILVAVSLGISIILIERMRTTDAWADKANGFYFLAVIMSFGLAYWKTSRDGE